ncbi:hypothetical protein [Candidatus Collinsella stercoripullorum]|uniref:hypothetical protein n=1 Tax=Candidatus Collinsella stercoripullorum TaxID=2838522 RepID=UPI0022E7162A|nr:hypothetical protein [Candidatus Collinsella stercoripullorum]
MEPKTIDGIDAEIAACKILLNNSDYQAMKHADGALTDEEYAEMKAKRQGWRDTINELEARRMSLEASLEGEVATEGQGSE